MSDQPKFDISGHVFMAIPEGAVVISRAENGWVVDHVEDAKEGIISKAVYEASEAVNGLEKALADALWDAFDGHTQSKWRGGLRIEVRAEGTKVEEEREVETQPETVALTERILRG